MIALPVTAEVTTRQVHSASAKYVFKDRVVRLAARIFTIGRFIRVAVNIVVIELMVLAVLHATEA